jgi:hypothetical protein
MARLGITYFVQACGYLSGDYGLRHAGGGNPGDHIATPPHVREDVF